MESQIGQCMYHVMLWTCINAMRTKRYGMQNMISRYSEPANACVPQRARRRNFINSGSGNFVHGKQEKLPPSFWRGRSHLRGAFPAYAIAIRYVMQARRSFFKLGSSAHSKESPIAAPAALSAVQPLVLANEEYRNVLSRQL